MLSRRATLVAVFLVGLCGQARAQTAPSDAEMRQPMFIFFDWRKDTLTDLAKKNVASAAERFRTLNAQQIKLVGTTDTSLPKAESEALSDRMANAVGVELMRDGVPLKAMSVYGFGWSHPEFLLVKTAPGVREPQNRNVAIVFPQQ